MQDLLLAVVASFEPINLLFLMAGVTIGIVFGVVPGLQNVTALSILLPFTYAMQPAHAFILMTGIYVAGIFGGSITAILYRIPGAPENLATSFDGYPLARKGQAAKALGTAIIFSATGGVVSVFVLIFAAPPLAKIALEFGPPEYFAMVFFALSMVALIGSSIVKSLLSGLLGLFFATVGVGPVSGGNRFTFGLDYLLSGFDFVALMVGVFAIAEVLARAEREAKGFLQERQEFGRVRAQIPSLRELWSLSGTFLRCTGLGVFIGILPALGATVAGFMGYEMERKISREGKAFGTGVLRGVAAPETANNASVGGAMIPFMTLGIPGSGSTVIMLAAFQIYGLQPGLALFQEQTELVYMIFAALLLSNAFILPFGVLAVPFFARMANIPFAYLGPTIVILCTIGAYTSRNNLTDVGAMFAFGVLGYLMEKHNFSISIFVLAFILGELAEASFLRSMIFFDNNPLMFFTQPFTGILIALGLISILFPIVRSGYTALARKGSQA